VDGAAAPKRSAERQALADAISAWRQAVADLARITDAQDRLGCAWHKTEALEAARTALEEARTAEAAFLVDELLGQANSSQNPVTAAEAALRDAEEDDRRHRKMFDLLAVEHEAADRRLRNQAITVSARRADVLRAERIGEQLHAERQAIFRQLAANAARWRALPAAAWGMVSWDQVPDADFSQSKDEVLSAAIKALETDADAPLPKL
jgi:hypothetical protein